VLVALLAVCTVLLSIYAIRKTDDIPAYIIPAAAPTSTITASASAPALLAPGARSPGRRASDGHFRNGKACPRQGN
jgi:hypothetical protein